ncbi:MAG: hypothetical protein GXO87_10260 [Chlorobi bacterium]|nr:hypothetical protein [Chlorobiota bacterium]
MSTDAQINNVLQDVYQRQTYTITHLSADKTYDEMTEDEKAEVRRLKKLDAEVKAHEEAHRRAAGELVRGGVRFSYKIGPDGKRYAVGGEVKIDLSEDPRGPKETKLKAEKIKRAANAPAKPSPKDKQVASSAERMQAEAEREIREMKIEKNKIKSGVYNASGEVVTSSTVDSSFNLTL